MNFADLAQLGVLAYIAYRTFRFVRTLWSRPNRQLRRIAQRQGWEPEMRDRQTHVQVPTAAGKVPVWSWLRNAGGKKERGWTAAASVMLPQGFLQHHCDAVNRFLHNRSTGGTLTLDPRAATIHRSTTTMVTLREVSVAIDRARQAARQLDFGRSEPMPAILQLAHNPPSPELGAASLAWILEHHADRPMLAELIEVGLRSPGPEHRLVAARAVVDERALHALSAIVMGGQWPSAIRIQALDALVNHTAFQAMSTQARQTLMRKLVPLVSTTQNKLLLKLLEAFDRSCQMRVPLDVLAARVSSVSTPCRVALVNAMARHEASAEPFLLDALTDVKPASRVVALRALGRFGGPHVLHAIEGLAKKWTTVGAEARAAADAMAALRARHHQAFESAGGLAFAEGALGSGGQLSEVADHGELELLEER